MLASLILRIHAEHSKRLGAYKIAYVLKRDYGINISVGRVQRLMKTLQLPQMSTAKPSGSAKHNDNGEYTDHLKRNFPLSAPNLVWASDITYLKAGGRWYYLCIIMDLFSRKVISWELSAKADARLVIDTFKKAYGKRDAPYGLMFHSDHGCQYTSFLFRRLLDSLNVVQSFSKKGCPFDSACCECFFKYLKKEETNKRTYPSFRELKLSVFGYIDGYYNSRRPHGTLGMLTPNGAETLYWEQNQ